MIEEILTKKITALILKTSVLYIIAFLLAGACIYGRRSYDIPGISFTYTPPMQAGTVLFLGILLLLILRGREQKGAAVLAALCQTAPPAENKIETVFKPENVKISKRGGKGQEREYGRNGIMIRQFQRIDERNNTFFDVFSIEAGKTGILHGEIIETEGSADGFSEIIQAMVRIQSQEKRSLSQIMESINRQLAQEPYRHTVRAKLIVWDTNMNCLWYSSAGERGLLLRERDDKYTPVCMEAGSLLNADKNNTYWEDYKYLSDESKVLLYNSGIEEIFAYEEEETPEEWLAEALLETEEIALVGKRLGEMADRNGVSRDILLVLAEKEE